MISKKFHFHFHDGSKDNAQRMMSHTARTKSDCQKTDEMFNQTIEKRIFVVEGTSGVEVDLYAWFEFGQDLGSENRSKCHVSDLL